MEDSSTGPSENRHATPYTRPYPTVAAFGVLVTFGPDILDAANACYAKSARNTEDARDEKVA